MNKIVFGFLAIAAIASFSDTSGNLEIDESVEFGKDVDISINNKAKIGVYLDSQKNLYGFAHLEKKDKILEKNSKIKRLVGLSYQKKLGDKTDIGFYGSYKSLVMLDYKEDESFKDELLKHLSAKNKYRDDFNFFQKTDALNRLGYKSENDKNLILGFHGNTRFKRTDVYLSGSYVTKNFNSDSNRLYAYLETNTMYNLGFFNAKVIYDLNNEKQSKNKVIHKNSNDDDIQVAQNGGALNLDFKFSSSRILQDTFFYNQAKLDLKSGLKATDKGERFLEFEQKNYFKYTGIKNLTTVGKLDYEFKHSVFFEKSKDDKKKSSNSELITENSHAVKVSVSADYVTDKYRLFGEFVTGNSIAKAKRSFINHSYDLKGIFEYNVLDNFKLVTDGNFRSYITGFFDNSDATLRLGYKSSGRDGRVIYDSKSNVGYRMFGYSKNDITNSIFSLSDNKVTYLNRGFKVEANLNFASEYEMVTREEDAPDESSNGKGKAKASQVVFEVAAAKKPSKPKAAPKAPAPKAAPKTKKVIKHYENLLLFLNPGFKMSYKKGNGYIGTDVQFVYSRDVFHGETNNRYGLMSKNEFRYDIKDNVTLITGLDLDYREKKLSFDNMKHFTDYVENLGFDRYKYFKYREKEKEKNDSKKNNGNTQQTVPKTKYDYNDNKKLKVEDEPTKDREVKVKVSLGSEIKLIQNKLSVKPTTSFTYVYSKENDMKENKYIGNIGLNISYNW